MSEVAGNCLAVAGLARTPPGEVGGRCLLVDRGSVVGGRRRCAAARGGGPQWLVRLQPAVLGVWGRLEGKKPLAVRSWTCTACGLTGERDLNAAVNILVQRPWSLPGRRRP
jgi:hypothetical protein